MLRYLFRLGVVGLCLGWLSAWVIPRAYPSNTTFGVGYGVAHGAFMPMALPSLIMGKDVPIYSERNDGRPYKIGYILGINLCGFVVFGTLFWRSSRKAGPPHARTGPQNDSALSCSSTGSTHS